MAIKLTTTAEDNFGQQVTLTDCYCRVSEINGNKTLISFTVDFFSSDKSRIYKSEKHLFAPSVQDGATNFIQQSYIFLKTLPEFTGGTDC